MAELSPDPELEPLSLAPPVLPPDFLRVKRLNILDRPPITVPFLDLLSLSASSLATSVLAAPKLNASEILLIFLFNILDASLLGEEFFLINMLLQQQQT